MNILKSCKAGRAAAPGSCPHTGSGGRSNPLLPSLGIATTLLLASCASVIPQAPQSQSIDGRPTFEQPAAVSVIDRSIVADIVRTTTQIFPPLNTTVQISKNNDDPLMEHFVSEFANSGYGIQRVSADQGSNYFSFTRSELTSESGERLVRFNSSIGAVDIGRDYSVPRPNMISPASPVRLSGTRALVTVPDTPSGRFLVRNPEFSKAVYAASLNLDQQAPPVISLITDDLVDRVAASTTQLSSLQALNSSRVEVSNLFYANQSNFSSILDNYEQVERQIVVFGNDSMILGNTNKLLIEQLVQQRLGEDDLISLVGCSNGPTVLDIGNEGLALGRAERVTEALLSQGVARDRILDEGCWAPVSAGNKFPSRGVVLELWRKTS